MTTSIRCLAAAILASPLAAAAAVIARGGEAPTELALAWRLLGAAATTALWGLPLAYVVFTVAAQLPRRPRAQDRLAEPRDATFVERLSITSDTREGW
jgi:hypothetical protein